MPRIAWDAPGKRVYYTGIDRGMLYIGSDVAVPWSGLSSVSESPAMADPQPYYLDGQKILNLLSGEDFGGTIEAFGAPTEFAPCAGRLHLSTGLYATDQPKIPFNFSYRTMIGNDSEGLSFGYKIHIVFNATAQISDYTHTTDTASVTVNAYSWNITTFPVGTPGRRPTSHFIFDSRFVDDYIIARLEAILYGDDDNDPRMPTSDELITFLTVPPGITWWVLTGLADFPDGAVIGDMGVDFDSDELYANVAEDHTTYWWDLTGGADFPAEALIGDWGIDTDTGEVWKYTG